MSCQPETNKHLNMFIIYAINLCVQTSGHAHFTWIRCSSVAWSWLLERTLTSSCSGGLARAVGAGHLSCAAAGSPPGGFAWVNTLGERSRLGATVAGILWGEMTCTDRSLLVLCRFVKFHYFNPTSIWKSLPETAVQLFGLQWLQSDLGLGLRFDSEWAPGIVGPVLERVEGARWRPGFAPAGPAAAFGGAREETPHLACGGTHLTKTHRLNRRHDGSDQILRETEIFPYWAHCYHTLYGLNDLVIGHLRW